MGALALVLGVRLAKPGVYALHAEGRAAGRRTTRRARCAWSPRATPAAWGVAAVGALSPPSPRSSPGHGPPRRRGDRTGARAVSAVMVLGCTSWAGKSLVATALCRWYADQGLRVAPFKGQNMSNNARVVAGGELGVAQWLQARAARVEPDVRMGPGAGQARARRQPGRRARPGRRRS